MVILYISVSNQAYKMYTDLQLATKYTQVKTNEVTLTCQCEQTWWETAHISDSDSTTTFPQPSWLYQSNFIALLLIYNNKQYPSQWVFSNVILRENVYMYWYYEGQRIKYSQN